MKLTTNTKEVNRFLGMCGFYSKYTPEFALIAEPLTNLTLRKVKFRWTDSCQQAFEKLKAKLMEALLLVRNDVSKPFVVTTDANDTQVGVVLSQARADGSDRAVGNFSKRLKLAETRYSVTDKQALAVVLTFRNFHHYLWGTRFTSVADHQPLTSIFKKDKIS